jgi:hypothetical protein
MESTTPKVSTNYQEFTNTAPATKFSQIKDFIDSNNFVAKISFMILILFMFLIAYQIIVRLIVYIYSPKSDIVLLNGTANASSMKTISQSPTSPSTLVMPSTNEAGGIEFTWSVWIYINELSSYTLYNPVFFKGNFNPYSGKNTSQCGSLNIDTNAPGLYIITDSKNHSATLQVLMDTIQRPSSFVGGDNCAVSNPVNIPHIPLNTWINVVIRCYGTTLDVYINGIIANSVILTGIPKQNSGNIYVTPNGGFNGYVSTLRYMNRSATNAEIQSIYQKGPNKKELDSDMNQFTKNNYFSFNWYSKN